MAIWRREQQKVSYAAHFAGAMAGIGVGIIALKNRKVETWEVWLKNACMAACGLICAVLVFWNIFKDYLEEKHVLSLMPKENDDQEEIACNWPF